jgi:Fic family protein
MILSSMQENPPFHITTLILRLSQEITYQLGLLSGAKIDLTPVQLRRINNIKTIQASLAIEGNTLNINNVTEIFEGKRVIGPEKDIIEVKNALQVYKDLSRFNPLSIQDLLKAHNILMKDLILENSQWRTGGIGIFKGKMVMHVAPPTKRTPALMKNLFRFLKDNKELPWLLKACIFHYELEFIHPFSDGNGRMGRLWQQLVLMKEAPVFQYVAIEVLIKKNQEKYYRVLEECDKRGDSTLFIEFCLEQILYALKIYAKTTLPTVIDSKTRIHYTKTRLSGRWFSRKEYLELHKNISSATASRDLLYGLKNSILKKKGEKNQARYYYNLL